MRCRATFASLLLTGLMLPTVAQIQYHPLEVGKKPEIAKTKSGKLAVWSLKPGASAQLDPEKALFGWAIRPPKGFVFTQKSEGNNQIFIFQGDPRPDRTVPVLWVVTGYVRAAENNKPQEEVIMDIYMIQLHENRENWKATPAEFGTIQGRKFIRRRWSATETTDGVTRHARGAVYLSLVSAKYVAVTVQDADPGAKSTVPLMEESIFTFHKR